MLFFGYDVIQRMAIKSVYVLRLECKNRIKAKKMVYLLKLFIIIINTRNILLQSEG